MVSRQLVLDTTSQPEHKNICSMRGALRMHEWRCWRRCSSSLPFSKGVPVESHQQGGQTTLLREVQLVHSHPRCQRVVGKLDEVNLEEWFLRRVPTLKKCPHFMRGRLRHCFAVALRERYRAKGAQDSRAEKRAWKLFGLVPVMLLHRPRGTRSIGKDELVSRADDFVRGRWINLLENIHDTSGQPRPAMGEIQEHERRGGCSFGLCAPRLGVACEAGAHWRSFGTKDSGEFCTVAREKAARKGQGVSSRSYGICS